MRKTTGYIFQSVICFTVVSTLIAFNGTAFAQESFSSLEERMTGKDFTESGLHKLSQEELAALNLWLHKHLGNNITLHNNQPNYSDNSGDNRGFENRAITDRTTVYSHIPGEFGGWDGETEFKLANGQVWKQTDSQTFSVNEIDVDITIKPKLLGSWMLSVDGYNKSCRVKRIR